MFDYFIKFSSNAHQICCEDMSDERSIIMVFSQSDDIDLELRSQLRLKVDNGYIFTRGLIVIYLRQCFSYGI